MENVDKIKRGEPVQNPDKIVKATHGGGRDADCVSDIDRCNGRTLFRPSIVCESDASAGSSPAMT